METKVLIDLAIKYGLSDDKVSKVAAIVYQLGHDDPKSKEFHKAANYICEMKLIDLPAEEIIEEMKRNGF